MRYFQIITLVLTIISVVIALFNLFQLRKTYYANHERAAKKDTIDAFHDLKIKSKDTEKFLYLKYRYNPIVLSDLSEEKKFEIKQYLSILERFSLGVNIGVYNINIANALSGAFFINTFNQLQPYIKEIRRERIDNNLYEEFEHMTNELVKIREKYSSTGGKPRFYPVSK